MRLLTFTRGGIVIACALTALVFESDDCGAQSAAVSDPYKVAATRLGNLSSLLDKHLEALSTVNWVAVDQSSPAASTSLQHYQLGMREFSQTLQQLVTDVSSLPPAQAKARLDAVVVPSNVQQLLQQGADGKILPAPPHLRAISVNAPTTLTPFVIGPGSAATVDYPPVAGIAYAWLGRGSSAVCTGTLVSPNAVLTAAHCFCELARVRTATACANTTYLRGLESVKPADPRFISVFFHDRGPLPVKEIVIHPDYDFPKKDLAVIRLTENIPDIMPARSFFGKS